MPFNVKSFYDPPIFSNDGRTLHDINFIGNNSNKAETSLNTTEMVKNENNATSTENTQNADAALRMEKRDVTAGELYKCIDSTLIQYV